MKHFIGAIILTSGFLLLDVTPALAHDAGRNDYYQPNHYRYDNIRRHDMPVWLKRDRHFKKWVKHSSLTRNRNLSWPQLYEIFRWEQAYSGNHYDRQYNYYGNRGHRNYDWYRKYWRHKQHRKGRHHRDWDRRH